MANFFRTLHRARARRRGLSKGGWFRWIVGILVTLFLGLYAQSQVNVINQIFPGLPTDHSTVTATSLSTTTITGVSISTRTSVSTSTVTLQPPVFVTLSGTAKARAPGATADQVRFKDEAGNSKVVDLLNGRYSINLTNGHTYTAEVHWTGYLGGWSTAVVFKLAIEANEQMPVRFDIEV